VAQSPNKFKMNSRSLWRKANPKLTEIDEFMKEISGNIESLLKELSDAKNKMSEIRASVNQRIENIKNEFSVVKRKMFNFLNLVFIAIRGELGGTVMSSLNKILEEMDKIVEEDLGKINVIANSKFAQDVNYIKVTLKTTFSAYEDLKNVRNKFARKIKNGLARIDKFIESMLSTKFQKLKDALVFIKSKTNLEDPTQSIVLY
jgi:archaellum component FlaC